MLTNELEGVNKDVYKTDWQWQEGEYTVTRTNMWTAPGCHNGCSVLYYTKDGKVYFAIDKEYLTYIGQAELEMNLPQIIDALLAQYPGLGIEATDDYYAIPLKYAVKDGVTTLKVDKEMMMPYMPLITSLVDAFLPDGDIEVSLDPESDPMKIPAKALVNSLLDALFNQSQSIEIGIGLTK